MTSTRHQPDTILKTRVVEELEWAPGVDATHIGVGVTDGAVTLSGEVGSYPEKRLAEKAVQRVVGIHAIAEEITVRATDGTVTDTDIARRAGEAIGNAVDIASNAVIATVEDGVVTLTGMVPWHYQRESAARSVRYLRGVRDLRNEIGIRPSVSTVSIKRSIEDALVRRAVGHAATCVVSATTRGEVTLEGDVGTWAERHQLEQVAWAAPGVTAVHNRLHILG